MIKGLYETHLFVENLEISIDFYKNVLGLEQCYYEDERRAAFFWIGKPKEAMLGLWEKPKSEIDKRHFAFRCETEFILNQATKFRPPGPANENQKDTKFVRKQKMHNFVGWDSYFYQYFRRILNI